MTIAFPKSTSVSEKNVDLGNYDLFVWIVIKPIKIWDTFINPYLENDDSLSQRLTKWKVI